MASLIEKDESLDISEETADFMLFLMEEEKQFVARLPVPRILGTKVRNGLNSEILTASIISRFEEAGLPTGPLLGNYPNVMENLVKIIIEEIIDAIQDDMRIDVAVD